MYAKGLAVSAPSRTSCPQGLIGISVILGATLNLDFASIKGCTYNGIFADGDATVTWTTVEDYRDQGIFSFGGDSTIKVSYSNNVAAEKSESPGQIGILLVAGQPLNLKNAHIITVQNIFSLT
jgi:hypothetical protein